MIFTLKTTQLLKSDTDTVWNFMSSPENLALITPKYMGFTILSDKEDIKKMYPGQIIHYYVTPVMGIKMNWVTEITHVSHHQFFVDEQRSGPYKLWNHKHFLKDIPGGVQIDDTVHYSLPLGFIGDLANLLFVKKKLEDIFEYRKKRMEEIFGIYTLINA